MSNGEVDEVLESPDLHFEPVITLAPVEVKTLEEDEEELVKLRAKLFRYDTESEPKEWKERGMGEIKILKHKVDGTCRVLMRRDKTFKICANHLVVPDMELKPNCGSDRAWVWTTMSDFADEEAKPQLLAVRFGSTENASKFKEAFDEAKQMATTRQKANDSATSRSSKGNSFEDSHTEKEGVDNNSEADVKVETEATKEEGNSKEDIKPAAGEEEDDTSKITNNLKDLSVKSESQ